MRATRLLMLQLRIVWLHCLPVCYHVACIGVRLCVCTCVCAALCGAQMHAADSRQLNDVTEQLTGLESKKRALEEQVAELLSKLERQRY